MMMMMVTPMMAADSASLTKADRPVFVRPPIGASDGAGVGGCCAERECDVRLGSQALNDLGKNRSPQQDRRIHCCPHYVLREPKVDERRKAVRLPE